MFNREAAEADIDERGILHYILLRNFDLQQWSIFLKRFHQKYLQCWWNCNLLPSSTREHIRSSRDEEEARGFKTAKDPGVHDFMARPLLLLVHFRADLFGANFMKMFFFFFHFLIFQFF